MEKTLKRKTNHKKYIFSFLKNCPWKDKYVVQNNSFLSKSWLQVELHHSGKTKT